MTVLLALQQGSPGPPRSWWELVVLEAVVVVILAAGAYALGRLLVRLVGGGLAIARASRRAHDQFVQELAVLSTEEIRQRLLRDPYFSDGVRRDAAVQGFLGRVANGDELALAAEYPRAKLYRFFVDAEHAAGRDGRPEAVDAIHRLSGCLQELARRAREAGLPSRAN